MKDISGKVLSEGKIPERALLRSLEADPLLATRVERLEPWDRMLRRSAEKL